MRYGRYGIQWLAVLAGGMASLSVTAVSANDLLDAYHRAQQQDATLQAALYQRDAAVQARPEALAAFLPRLTASSRLTRERANFDQAQGSVVQSGGGVVPVNPGASYGTLRQYALTLDQTLWSFGDFYQLQSADFQAAQAEAAYRSTQQKLILRVESAYFGVLSAVDRLRTNRLERDAFATLLDQAEKRQQTGLAARTDVEEAQSFYDATAQSVIDAQDALDDAVRALQEITAGTPTRLAPLRESIPLVEPDPPAPQAWVETAKQNNFDLRAQRLSARAAERQIDASWSQRLPTLNLQGNWIRDDNSAVFGDGDRLGSVGLVVNWPIFQGGAVRARVQQARASWRQARAQLEALRRSVDRQTRAAYRGVTLGADRVRADRKAVDSGKAAVEASRIGVEFGSRTEFDLLNAQTNYYNTLRAYLQSRYDYLISLLTLKQLAGSLSEGDLQRIDSMLAPGNTVDLNALQAVSP
ncbi:MAG: TolC family outer membrane protein [Gammaproteobacteria bacterium]|nr:TolC family outer membrane protein [Gammaproteobacteria bacterium]